LLDGMLQIGAMASVPGMGYLRKAAPVAATHHAKKGKVS